MYIEGTRSAPGSFFTGRKNMEHKVRNVRMRDREGINLLDFIGRVPGCESDGIQVCI